MKATIWVILLTVGLFAGKSYGQKTTKFNFSRAAQPVSGWVNVYGDPSVDTVEVTDSTTGFRISSVTPANWSPFGVGCSYDGGGAPGGTFFPAAVMLNQWSQYSDYYALYNAAIPQFRISGLKVDSVYTLKMTGSFNDQNGLLNPNPTRFTVAGTTVYGFIDVNAAYNTSSGAVFHNIVPDATGSVRVYVNTYGGSTLASINGIQIVEERSTAPTPVVAITYPHNTDALPEIGNVNLTATATETGGTIVKVEFYVNDALIGTDSSAPYNCSWIDPPSGKYTLKARAIDGLGNASTATINISIESLGSFWSTTGNIATGGDSNFIGTVDTNRLAIRTNNIERMSILGNGSIGIGTKNTYGYLLAVNGSAIFTKVRIKTAGTWPDYVFKKGYRLLNRHELESYLAQNKHLPGIAPEKEVNRDGLDIGEHQGALLRKVEELTLYLIDDDKRLNTQNRKLAEQNQAIAEQKKQLAEQSERLDRQQKEIDELKRLIKKRP